MLKVLGDQKHITRRWIKVKRLIEVVANFLLIVEAVLNGRFHGNW